MQTERLSLAICEINLTWTLSDCVSHHSCSQMNLMILTLLDLPFKVDQFIFLLCTQIFSL